MIDHRSPLGHIPPKPKMTLREEILIIEILCLLLGIPDEKARHMLFSPYRRKLAVEVSGTVTKYFKRLEDNEKFSEETTVLDIVHGEAL